MQSHHAAGNDAKVSLLRRFVHLTREWHEDDMFVLFGLPLLIAVGVILGVINLLAGIHLVAVLLNG
jgi:hypothetical protein